MLKREADDIKAEFYQYYGKSSPRLRKGATPKRTCRVVPLAKLSPHTPTPHVQPFLHNVPALQVPQILLLPLPCQQQKIEIIKKLAIEESILIPIQPKKSHPHIISRFT
jgi:hypothetical protein